MRRSGTSPHRPGYIPGTAPGAGLSKTSLHPRAGGDWLKLAICAYIRSPHSTSAAAERLWITYPEVCGASDKRLRRARASQWSAYFESLAVRPQNAYGPLIRGKPRNQHSRDLRRAVECLRSAATDYRPNRSRRP